MSGRGCRAFRNPDEEPDGPVFTQHGGGGGSSGGGRAITRPGFWLWPVPEIPLSTAAIDGVALAEAAGRTTPLWPSA